MDQSNSTFNTVNPFEGLDSKLSFDIYCDSGWDSHVYIDSNSDSDSVSVSPSPSVKHTMDDITEMIRQLDDDEDDLYQYENQSDSYQTAATTTTTTPRQQQEQQQEEQFTTHIVVPTLILTTPEGLTIYGDDIPRGQGVKLDFEEYNAQYQTKIENCESWLLPVDPAEQKQLQEGVRQWREAKEGKIFEGEKQQWAEEEEDEYDEEGMDMVRFTA